MFGLDTNSMMRWSSQHNPRKERVRKTVEWEVMVWCCAWHSNSTCSGREFERMVLEVFVLNCWIWLPLELKAEDSFVISVRFHSYLRLRFRNRIR